MKKATNRPFRTLDYSEEWFRDGLALCRPPAFSESLEVDLSAVRDLITRSREQGLHLTYSHVLVRAVALALAANPGLHSMVCGSKVYFPGHVDIALSISAETAIAPVLVVESANQKNLKTIADEILRRVPEVKEEHRKMLDLLKNWGWLIPFGFFRRHLLKLLHRSLEFRRKGSGTFQLSVMPEVDAFVTPMFNTCAILTAGRVKDRVIAIGGMPVVRPTIQLTCSADHRVWNGRDCQTFLLAVQKVLLSGFLDAELKETGMFEGETAPVLR